MFWEGFYKAAAKNGGSGNEKGTLKETAKGAGKGALVGGTLGAGGGAGFFGGLGASVGRNIGKHLNRRERAALADRVVITTPPKGAAGSKIPRMVRAGIIKKPRRTIALLNALGGAALVGTAGGTLGGLIGGVRGYNAAKSSNNDTKK